MSDGTVSFPAGSRVSGYRLEHEIGRGGMAVVFRARDEQLGRLVALKVLAPSLAGDEAFRRRFIRESQAVAAIDDPHIVPVFAAGEADGVLFIAMRYVPGGDAQSLLGREGPLPPARVASVISPVASALDAAHAAGLLHRDVKPSNMLVDVLPGRPDHVYLSDFGLSKGVASTSGTTKAGELIGTVEYMPPEQVTGERVDGRGDQYALACATFAMLTGEPPFRRDTPAGGDVRPRARAAAASDRAASGAAAGGRRRAGQGPGEGAGERYASCAEFADALRGALGFEPYVTGPTARSGAPRPGGDNGYLETATVTPPPPPSPPDGPRRTAQAGVAAATCRHRGRGGRRRDRGRVAVALIVALLPGNTPKPAAKVHHPVAAPVPVTMPIAAKSARPAVDGFVYVYYRDGKMASAEIAGDVSKPADGEVVRLYAQQFPFTRPAAPAGESLVQSAGATAAYQFQVTPSLVTRYHVELFRSSTATAPLAASPVTTVYVALGGPASTAPDCPQNQATCHVTVQVASYAPPAALAAEMAKPVSVYFGIAEAANKPPADPKLLTLGAGGARVTAKRRLSANEYSLTVTFTFAPGNGYYNWQALTCSKDTEAADGIGLPGHHGCGDEHGPARSTTTSVRRPPRP